MRSVLHRCAAAAKDYITRSTSSTSNFDLRVLMLMCRDARAHSGADAALIAPVSLGPACGRPVQRVIEPLADALYASMTEKWIVK